MKINHLIVVFLLAFSAWVYQNVIPPPPIPVGTPGGLPITSPRIKLRDGRHLSYKESGVPKDSAKAKIVFVHGFNADKNYNPFAISASPEVIQELGIYLVAFDRPGSGESDPNPTQTPKSLTTDIEELADQLNLGSKFYVIGYSMGGLLLWPVLKYIPHRLAGAVLIAPAVNYRWPDLPSDLTKEEYSGCLIRRDQWAVSVAYYLPWLTYWWNTQKWFRYFSLIDVKDVQFSPSDSKLISYLFAALEQTQVPGYTPRQQGDFVSVHRDMITGFGRWSFGLTDVKNPFPNKNGSVHLWMGDDDHFVSVSVIRYIARKLEWIKYHELAGKGHMMAYEDVVADAILKALVDVNTD